MAVAAVGVPTSESCTVVQDTGGIPFDRYCSGLVTLALKHRQSRSRCAYRLCRSGISRSRRTHDVRATWGSVRTGVVRLLLGRAALD